MTRASARLARRGPWSLGDDRQKRRGNLSAFCGAVSAVLFAIAVAHAASAAEVDIPIGNKSLPISIQADSATSWKQGAYEVWVLRGRCLLRQGDVVARSAEAVMWIDRAELYSGRNSKVIGYFEGDVTVDFGTTGDPLAAGFTKRGLLKDRSWVGRFHTVGGIDLKAPLTSGEPNVKPAIFDRGSEARTAGLPPLPAAGSPSAVQPAQFAAEVAPPAATPALSPNRRVRLFPRSTSRWNLRSFSEPNSNERITMISSGVQIMVEGLDQLGNISVETDRVVIWSSDLALPGAGGESTVSDDTPVEFYLEGNIVFRQGDRVIYADRMYYNVTQEYGVVLSAELLTPVPQYQGLVRLKADVLQQANRQHFEAYGAAFTGSRLGVPRYWLQAEAVSFDDMQTPLVDPFSNQPLTDPATGEPQVDHRMLAQSRNNFIYLFETPVLYWPKVSTDLTKPSYFIDSVNVRNDGILGTQVLVNFDMYQLLGITNRPPGSTWQLSTDYLSQRGFALGTNGNYMGDTLFGIPGPYYGHFDAWGLRDNGLDTLGADRVNLVPETRNRGRAEWFHRQTINDEYVFTGEVGYITDRNFLEQFYENEWDNFKDKTTGLELKRYVENMSYSITADVRLNDFFTQTEWLPRLDHFWLGQSLLNDTFTWYEHSHVGYARLQTAVPPTNPVDAATFDPLPWEVPSEGIHAATRQELDLPVQVGGMKVVPYVLGEAAVWGQDINGDQTTRLLGQTGVRSSLPFYSIDPNVRSEIFNLNGLAHKVVLESEFLYADADKDLNQFPLYENLDDDATEHFRRRLKFETFGLPAGTDVPLRFDERYFAFRNGMQSWVTAPSTEIADDLMFLRAGMRNRWQTKRGLPGQERIIDWIVFDLEAVYFPKEDRDNFGTPVGLIDYEFRWHVGDRVTLLSDGFTDFFDQGLKQYTAGLLYTRPELGNLYVGYRSSDGPINSEVLVAAVNYRMNEKYIFTGGASVDLGQTGNIGQNIALTRVGESALIRIGATFDASRDNIGINFLVEPRFLPRTRLGNVGGVPIPPAGARGLE
jgi:hypothetical protein